MWDAMKGPKADPSEVLTRFLLITLADLKKYKFYYWFAFPAFAAQPLWEITFRKLNSVRSQSSSLRQPPHSSLYGPQKVTMFSLHQCKSSPISLQKCLSSHCVPVLLIS